VGAGPQQLVRVAAAFADSPHKVLSGATAIKDSVSKHDLTECAMYAVELFGTAIFAITGVLAVSRRGLDLIGALVLGLVTAVGGGTVRDVLMRYQVFWFEDVNYIWAALAGAAIAFFLSALIRNAYRALLYLDALGAALFAIAATNKGLLDPTLSGSVAVILGVLTGIGGGLLRDVLAGRQTLLMSRDIYATPILLGCALYVTLLEVTPGFEHAALCSATLIFTLRAAAIWFHLEMFDWLVQGEPPS
jgi:uncharacterized membrane protein YeiH